MVSIRQPAKGGLMAGTGIPMTCESQGIRVAKEGVPERTLSRTHISAAKAATHNIQPTAH